MSMTTVSIGLTRPANLCLRHTEQNTTNPEPESRYIKIQSSVLDQMTVDQP